MTVEIMSWVGFGSLILTVMQVVCTDQTVAIEQANHFGVIPSGAVRIPSRIAVEVSSSDNGSIAEPTTMFYETTVNFSDVIVGTLCTDRTGPDCQQVEIQRPMNPDGNDPFAEGLGDRLNCEPFAAKDSQPLVWIGTEPQAGQTVRVQVIH